MLPSIRLLQLEHNNNFPFLAARILKFGPETIHLVLNIIMTKDRLKCYVGRVKSSLKAFRHHWRT